MKYYSARGLHGAAAAAQLLTDADLKAKLRQQLDGTEVARLKLAGRIGVGERTLSRVLRNQMPVPADVAAGMGYRKVTRFEPI